MRKFSSGVYGRQRLEFFPAPYRAPLRAFAALVFAWHEDQVLLCDIEDRGWCIPSGRVEPEESSLEAAIREAREEAGAVIEYLQYLGCYRITEREEVRWADVYAGDVSELQDLEPAFESRGRKLVFPCELPDLYHLWTPLTEELFQHSREAVLRRRATLGVQKREA